jgi:hypothetical protein
MQIKKPAIVQKRREQTFVKPKMSSNSFSIKLDGNDSLDDDFQRF